MYNSNEVAKKIKLLARSKKIPLKQMFSDIGLGFNTMSNMKNSMPKADNLAKMADYLDCSVDYLLGRTDVEGMCKSNALSLENDEIDVSVLIIGFTKLNPSAQNAVIEYLNFVASQSKNLKTHEDNAV